MYCGDETGSFVGDLGSSTSRFGYGGEDAPKYVVPSFCAGQRVLSSAQQPHDDVVAPWRMAPGDGPIVDPTQFLQQSDVLADRNAYQTIWESALDRMNVKDRHKHRPDREIQASGMTSATVAKAHLNDGIQHPFMVSTPGMTFSVGEKPDDHKKHLVEFTEILMETFQCPSLFLAPSPMLASFAHGRPTALVVDMGAGGCRVTPVVDGLILRQAQRRNGRGGDWLDHVLWKSLDAVQPRYQSRGVQARKGIFHRWACQELMYEVRTSGHVQLGAWRYDPSVPFRNDKKDEMDTSTGESVYTLPDGTEVDWNTHQGHDVGRLYELWFTDETPYVDDVDQSILSQHPTLSNAPLHKLIRESLSAVEDVDLRKDLAGNILLTGGASVVPKLDARLSYELSQCVSGAFKCKVVASKFNVERSCASWIGGSVLSSLGSFQQLWLSQAEYEEYGPSLAVQRFPL